ncbi:MAG: DNA-directed RNA polymerase subunit K [Candidatus Nanohaloarchaeota archaeon QJJ-9]|nr:DNA-directed RNA polymerase subunit K [Candidatus Nanohaloarchaeota archaeon QJJ-9]
MTENYTRFERARLIGARALQISQGAPPLIETEKTKSIDIAEEELDKDVIPLAVRRKRPGEGLES